MEKEIFSFNEDVISERITAVIDRLINEDADYRKAEDTLYSSTIELSNWVNKAVDERKPFEEIFCDYVEKSNNVQNVCMRAVYKNAFFDCIAMLKKHDFI